MIPIDWDFSKPGAFTVVHHFLICGRGLLHFYLGHFQVACVSKDFVGLWHRGADGFVGRMSDVSEIDWYHIYHIPLYKTPQYKWMHNAQFYHLGGCLKWGRPPSWRSWCLDVGLSAYLDATSRQQPGCHYSDHKTWGHMGTVFLFLNLEILAQLDI
jgi:hypothetical protein